MRTNPERFALNVLLAAFAGFLLLCGGTIYAIQWFIFQSQVPMDITLTVSRGTVSVVPPDTEEAIAVTDQRNNLAIGGRISTDTTSQGLLSFKDPRTDRLVAEWVLHHDSDVTLDSALAPRFGLNPRHYMITVTSRNGGSEALLLTTTSRQVDFTINTRHATALFNRAGHYLLDISDDETRLTTRQGLAEVMTQGEHAVTLDPDERAIVKGTDAELVVQDAERDLLENGYFRLPDMAGWNGYTLGSDPRGTASSIIYEGRPVVLLDRPTELFVDTPFNHGEVGLNQTLNLPAHSLAFLEMRATFRVTEQSLSTCGFAGSECPLMMRMNYLDQAGEERVWIHGFYVTHNPALEYPLRCDSCALDHERLAPNRWHTFESGNLMTLLPAEQKPAVITDFRFYASGHAFKVYVAEMNLLGAP